VDGLVGITSLAAGADQLFASEVLRANGSLEVIIPSDGYRKSFEEPLDRSRFDDFLARATDAVALPYPFPSEEAFLAAGIALVERCDVLIAAWDGMAARGLGGTADVVKYARSRARTVLIVWPDGLER
jgi:hypothetical protein